jgi:hypothetical protein
MLYRARCRIRRCCSTRNAKTLSAVMGVLGVPPMQFEHDVQPVERVLRLHANYFTELGTPPAVWPAARPRPRRRCRRRAGGGAELWLLAAAVRRRPVGGGNARCTCNRQAATVARRDAVSHLPAWAGRAPTWLPIAQQPYFVRGQPRAYRLGSGLERADVGTACAGRDGERLPRRSCAR